MNHRTFLLALLTSFCGLHACASPEEALRVQLSVTADPSGVAQVTSDLGYAIEVTEARAAIENLAFTIAGEAHTASLWRKVSDFLIPTAYAHPGHFQGGDVTGELRGRFIIDWLPGTDAQLGDATLLVGVYKSANFTLIRATEDDGVASDDPLLGHTALLRGRATKGASDITFVALIDSPAGRELIGAPFEFEVKQDSRERLGVRLATVDPLEGDTLFDGIDFAALDSDGDGQVVIEETSTDVGVVEAYNVLRRTFQTHDHFDIKTSLPE
jgi:hypothetical protein